MKKNRQRGFSVVIIVLIIVVILLAGIVATMAIILGIRNASTTDNVRNERIKKEENDDSDREETETEDPDRTAMADTDDDSTNAVLVDDSYKTQYGEIIRNNLEDIRNYNWQFGYDYDEYGNNTPSKEPRPIALFDINGDGVDELFYMHAVNEYQADLQLDAYFEDSVLEVFTDSYDIMVAGGFYYCIFQVEGSDNVFVYFDGGDEMWETYIREYHLDNMCNFEQVHEWQRTTGPNEDYSGEIETYAYDGKTSDAKTFDAKKAELDGSITKIILHNTDLSHFELDSANESKFIGMTLYDALAATSQGEKLSAEDTTAFYKSLPDNFGFSSGAGGWGTGVSIKEDGSFEGSFHDSNMGESGSGYDATVYYCDFTGTFKEVRKVNDYTYALYLDELLLSDKEGKETIENVDGAKVRNVASYPYGMDGCPEFLVYTPDAPLDKLPEEYKNWIYGLSDKTGKLEMYGLYNVIQQDGFSGYDN